MSPRILALLLLAVYGTVHAATEVTDQSTGETVEIIEQQVAQTTQATDEVVAETVDSAENTQAAVEEVAKQVETTAAQAEETAEAAAEEVIEEAETAAAETEAAAEAVSEETVEEAETAAAETEAAAEAVSEETVEEAETAAAETEAAAEAVSEETAEEAETVAAETEAAAEAVSEETVEEAETAAAETEAAAEEMVEETETATAESEETAEAATEETAMAADSSAGVEAKIAACAACHGADGNSVIPQNPKLAGQVPGFIADQLAKFKSGERDNAIMTAQVANLTDEDMQQIDAFYASQQAQLGAVPEDMVEIALEGQKIFRGGEPSMSISACMSCHGPNGDGIPIRFPRVSGQHVEYLEAQLLAYKTGARKSSVMNPIAFRLSEDQIKALSIYMHGLK